MLFSTFLSPASAAERPSTHAPSLEAAVEALWATLRERPEQRYCCWLVSSLPELHCIGVVAVTGKLGAGARISIQAISLDELKAV